MKKILLVIMFSLFTVISASQNNLTKNSNDAVPSTTQPPASRNSKIYYGGNIGFNFFGDVFRISIAPLVGYKITPKLSAGVKVAYEYYRDKRFTPTFDAHNYGGSFFTRYRIIPQIYAHAEFAYVSYDLNNLGREGVPFILLGGGVAQNIGNNAWVFAEVLFDVLQDDNSPYKKGEPFVSVGAGIGF